MKAASRLLQRVVPGRSGGDDIREIGSPAWARARRESMLRDYEIIKEIADKRPLLWDDEHACLAHSAANSLYNCIQDVRQRSQAVVRARALGGYREVCVKIADGHCVIPRAEVQDRAAVVDDSLYFRPALRRSPIAPFKPQKEGIRGAIAAYVKSSFAQQETWESLADVQARDDSHQSYLMDSISVISGADTVQEKSPDVSKSGASDQTRHGLPACDWSLHGLDSQRAAHPKTTEELQSELMALAEEALLHGTIKLTDRNCDLAHVWSYQSQALGGARQTKPQLGLGERIRQILAFGSKSTGACSSCSRAISAVKPPPAWFEHTVV
jgi:hypothetical protein